MRTKIILSSLILSATVISQSAWAANVDQGKQKYTQLCASCHGPEGAGDGPIAAGLPENQKPRNFQKADFKVATDDTKMRELIKKGGAAFGLSPLMAPQPGLNESDLDNLIAFVGSLRKK